MRGVCASSRLILPAPKMPWRAMRDAAVIALVEQDAKIIFIRPGGLYRDALRSYALEVDDVRRGRIKPGQTVAIDVEPGPHTVRARISWTGSPRHEVNLGPGEEIRLRVEPAGTPDMALSQLAGRTGYLRIAAEQSQGPAGQR
jgi:hypothetical protein